MVGWGILLIVLGAGSLLLPMFDIQFTLMSLLDDYQPYAGIVVAVIGLALVLYGTTRRESVPATASQAPAPEDAERP